MTQASTHKMNRVVSRIEAAMTQSFVPLMEPLSREQSMPADEILIAMSMASSHNAVSMLSASRWGERGGREGASG